MESTQSDTAYHQLVESMDQGFCVMEMIYDGEGTLVDYRFLEINKVFEQQTGIVNALGRTMRDILPEGELQWLSIYGNVAATGESIRFVEESGGLGRWFDVYAFSIGEVGNGKVGLLFRDITNARKAQDELRESEERFRNLADDSPMFVFIIDAGPEAPVSYWNKTWLEYTGQSHEAALGRAWDGIIHPDDVAVVMGCYGPAFEAQTFYFIPAVRVKRFDNVYRWHAFKGNPRYLSTGEFNGYVGVGFDIHEQKLNEEKILQSEARLQLMVAERTAELQSTVEELKRSNQNLEQFAYAASHDLKEPMRKVQIFADRLRENLQPMMSAADHHYFDRITSATKRMNTLIEDILTYSHVSNGVPMTEMIDLNKKVELVLGDLELEIEDKQAVITVGKLPLVKGHRRQLQQLFQNLIGNALKYSSTDRQPEIVISSRAASSQDMISVPGIKDAANYHLIEIRDNGVGFSPKENERIFNMFTRLHGNDLFKGSGVGLAIARKVTENHHGYIWAESTEGAGATFKILLPSETGA